METLIAITIFAIIAVIMAATVKLCLRSVDKGDAKAQSTERLRAAVNLLQSQIQSAVPMMYSDNGSTKKYYYFKGSDDSLVFVSNVSAWGRDRGIVAVKYEIDGSGSLMVTEWDMFKNNKRSAVLLANMKGASFKSTVHRTENVEAQTEADVDKTDTMPEYVEIDSPIFGKAIHIPIAARDILQTSATAASKAAMFDPAIFQ
ncbi:MAG: hypothetical protein L7F77_04535 [Candidatus Magnetominusculus sp. LBB02]|nr:hypothetical protein [Candidatus Magnetominusculus sp. LBB02]